jgi:hypothetical protein
MEYEAALPQNEQVRGTIALCRAIRRHQAMNTNHSPIMTRSTANIMIPIHAMADHQADLPLVTVSEYNAIC